MTDLIEALRQVPEFKNVPNNQLQWLADKGNVTAFQDGDTVFRKGDPIDCLKVLLKGEVNFYIEQAGNLRLVGVVEQFEITGQLPFSRMKGATGTGVVKGDALIYSLHKDYFQEMIRSHYELVEALVHVMTDRVRDFTRQQQQNDKMMALGKLSAGLAHELNNPSAAVVRSAHELKRHLSTVPEDFKRVIQIKATDEIVDQVKDLMFAMLHAGQQNKLTLMQKTNLEDELTDWLEENDIDNGYQMIETFTEFGVGIKELKKVKALVKPEDKSPLISWLHQLLTTEKLVGEIEEAAKRINALVTSVKGYTHMDQAPEKTPVDIHLGIRNTLVMLQHKLKKNNITLIESYQHDVPHASIFVSPMNQVWTNIIDNAIDAMEGRPGNTLEIKTEHKGEFLLVSIIDNGPGIPNDILDKIFDPFFTTKAIGKGTGLGLEVARQIISQHNGKIDVTSVPGKTTFVICIPIK